MSIGPRRAVVFALLVLAGAGCGGESLTMINTDDDAKKISLVVEQFNDWKAGNKQIGKIFTKSALPKPAELKKYAAYGYMTTDAASVSGDSATMKISLRDEKTSEDAGKTEWTFKKEADGWKIEKAPLP